MPTRPALAVASANLHLGLSGTPICSGGRSTNLARSRARSSRSDSYATRQLAHCCITAARLKNCPGVDEPLLELAQTRNRRGVVRWPKWPQDPQRVAHAFVSVIELTLTRTWRARSLPFLRTRDTNHGPAQPRQDYPGASGQQVVVVRLAV